MYKLCGGTLLVLLVHSGNKGTTETSLLSDTLKVFKSDLFIDKCTLKEQTKKFKLCKEHSSLATPFEDSSLQKQLTDDIKNNYVELLKRTSELIDHYIDTDSQTKKDELLVKALLEVIDQDESISDDQEFYILPNGKTVTKLRMATINKIYLPSFLLGIIYYSIINIKDNKEGSATYDEWCPKPKSGTQRKYVADIGENSKKKVELINSPDGYSNDELLELSGELKELYIKPIPTSDDYEISSSPIITSDCPETSEKSNYVKIKLYSSDYHTLTEFISDFNNLISCVKNYRNSNIKDEICILGEAKLRIIDKWVHNPNRVFINGTIQKRYSYIINKVKKSAVIDIENITIKRPKLDCPIKLKPGAKSGVVIPYIKVNYMSQEEDSDNNYDPPENK